MTSNKWCDNCEEKVALFSCGNCYQYKYCGKECQQEHWVNGGHDTSCVRTGNPIIEEAKLKRFYWELTDEEIKIERHFDKLTEGVLTAYLKRKFLAPCFNSHKWLIDEWNKNSKLLLNAVGDNERCKELLIHRLAVGKRLDEYENN